MPEQTNDPAPPPGTTRYLCPLECGWHHDVPPPNVDRFAELGVITGSDRIVAPADSLASRAVHLERELTEKALRAHLDTHGLEEFIREIESLRSEVVRFRLGGGRAR